MLINAHRRTLTSKGFLLPDWIRGPLSLNAGSLSWCVLNTGTKPTAAELIVSNFEPKHWPDLWRLEIETFDKKGTLTAIIAMLQNRNMELLAAEGSVNTPGGLHTMSFIFSCVEYDDPEDKKSEHRQLQSDVLLRGFYNWMAVKFIDVLSFATGERPRLRISRMSSHRELHLCLSNGNDYNLIPTPILISGSYLKLSSDKLKDLKQHLGKTIYYTPTVDTKDRLIRILLFGENLSAPLYFQFPSLAYIAVHAQSPYYSSSSKITSSIFLT